MYFSTSVKTTYSSGLHIATSTLESVTDTIPRTYQAPRASGLSSRSSSGMKTWKALPLSPLHADVPAILFYQQYSIEKTLLTNQLQISQAARNDFFTMSSWIVRTIEFLWRCWVAISGIEHHCIKHSWQKIYWYKTSYLGQNLWSWADLEQPFYTKAIISTNSFTWSL